MHQLYYLLHGVRHWFPRSSRRRSHMCPITVPYLQHLIQHIQLANLHPVDKVMLHSAVTLAFFGMLHSAEYTSPFGQCSITSAVKNELV